jgi:hypothetical protein
MSKIRAQPVHFGQSSAPIFAKIQKSALISKILDIAPKNKLQIPKPRRQQLCLGYSVAKHPQKYPTAHPPSAEP